MKPRKYNSDFVKEEIVVTSRRSKLGELFFMVSFKHQDKEMYVCFENMSSVLDFIHSNF